MNSNIEHLYIHVPFCSVKCDYCAFHSLPSPSDLEIDQYFNRILIDILNNKNLTGDLKSIYIGGGTPSFLKAEQLQKLINIIQNNFSIADNAEISIECNPDSLTPKKIKIISNFVNRISFGVQTFNSNMRNILGRQGSLKKLNNDIELFQEHNITNISFDLIYAIPGENLDIFKEDLKQITSLPLKHISLYSLTFEEGTKLTNKLSSKEKEFDDLSADMWEFAEIFLEEKNISRYEVSNYAQKGYECKHNLNTWFGGKLLGIGPTASSFDGKIRWTNQPFSSWLSDNHQPEIDEISVFERFIEIFSMGLRTNFLWDINVYKANTVISSKNSFYKFELSNFQWNVFRSKLMDLEKLELLIINTKNHNNITVNSSKKGQLFWDEICIELMDLF